MATVTKPIALDESINTTEVTPRNVADVLAQELANIASAIGGGGGSGGHTIENSSGTALPQRTNLQFTDGLNATDDSGNDATVVSGSALATKTDIATVESGSTASRAYSVGELVYVNGNLYKVITAISLGSAFTVGTNIQSTTVSEALEDSKRVTLYNTAFTYDNTVVLNDSAENYEFLEIRIADSSDSSSSRGGIVISKGLYNITGFYPVRQSDYIRVSANGTSFRFVSGSSSIYIHSIVGIKN